MVGRLTFYRSARREAPKCLMAWKPKCLTPAMVTLVALGKYPASEATKLILGLLAAPAIVYWLNSFGMVRNGFYDNLKDTLEKTATKNFGEPQKKAAPPNIAAGSDPAMTEN